MKQPAPFWMKWATTISPLTITISGKICNTRTPSPCSTGWKKLAADRGLEFGLKLSNTFPVDVKAGELPSEEMYMAGKEPLPSDHHHGRAAEPEFDGKLRLSYAGGADAFNIDKLFTCGIWPITMATTELKPGGYQRFTQIGEILDKLDFAPSAAWMCWVSMRWPFPPGGTSTT